MAVTERRLALLHEKMKENGTDFVALAPGSHMQWLLGFYPHPDERPCLLLVSATGETFLMPALNAEGSREHTDISFQTWSDDQGPNAALAAALAEVGVKPGAKIALDETMRADFALLLLGAVPDAKHTFLADTVGALRMRKDEDEYARLKMNALIADRAMQAA